MISPNKGVSYNSMTESGQKYDSLRKTPTSEYSQEYPMNPNINTSMSFLTLNNSAEKNLNYSKANVSFRQVSFSHFCIGIS